VFAVAAGAPAQQGEEIEQRLGEIAVAAEVVDEDLGEVGFRHPNTIHHQLLVIKVELLLFVCEPL
jgi:hypothetical protein